MPAALPILSVKPEILVTSDDPYTLESLKSNQCFSLEPQQSVKSYGEDGDGSGLQTAVSVRVPLEHDLDPDKVYPLLQVGVHVAPSARVEVHPEPGAPFVMAPDASHDVEISMTLSSTEEAVTEPRATRPLAGEKNAMVSPAFILSVPATTSRVPMSTSTCVQLASGFVSSAHK